MYALMNKLATLGIAAGGLGNTFGDLADELTAVGSSQADAYESNTALLRFTTVAAGTGVKLDNGSKGDCQLVVNDGANDLVVYPHSTGQIENLSVDEGVTIAPGSAAVFYRSTSARWFMLPAGSRNAFGIGWANVRQYGARGNGVRNDTSAFVAALAANDIVYVPKGVYRVSSFEVPAGKTIITDGFESEIYQLSGQPVATPIIRVTGSNVRIGVLTLRGNIATDSGEHMHGIICQAAAAYGNLSNIFLSDYQGYDLRGDLLYIGQTTGYSIQNVVYGNLTADNIYRNVVSWVSGMFVTGGDILATRVGLAHLDIEPNVGSGPCITGRFGNIKGRIVGLNSPSAADYIQDIKFESADLSPANAGQSVPSYAPGAVVEDGLLLRNTKYVEFGSLRIQGFNRSAIFVTYNPGELGCEMCKIGGLYMRDCSLTDAVYNAYVQGANARFDIDYVDVEITQAAKRAFDTVSNSIVGQVKANIQNSSMLARSCTDTTFKRVEQSGANGFLLVASTRVSVLGGNFTGDRLGSNCVDCFFSNFTATAAVFLFTSGQENHTIINSTLNGTYYQFASGEGSTVVMRVASYTALRAYRGAAQAVMLPGNIINGIFWRDSADAVSADNGGTIIVDALGRRWKRLLVSDYIHLEWFEGIDFTGVGASDTGLVNFFNACRTTGKGARSGPGTIRVTQSHNAADIKFIDMFMASLQGNLGATHMISIGASTGVLTEANIKLKVVNTTSSSTAGNKGIRMLGIRSSDCTFYMEGFNVGCYYDGTTGLPSNLLDNRFWNTRSYNCGTGFHFDLANTAYVNANQWYGGGYYLGTGVKVAGRAPFKLTTTGASTQFADNIVWNAEISLDANSWHANSATHFYVENNNTAVIHSMYFRECRFELNAGPAVDDLIPFNVAVNPNLASRVHCEIDLTSANYLRWMPFLGDQKNNSFIMRLNNQWSALNNQTQQRISLPEVFPYQTSDGVYVPDRTIFDTSFTTPVQIITGGVAALTTRANGDGKLYCQTPTVSYGRKYAKSVGYPTELDFPVATTILIICYDATGAVIGGTAPWYVQATGVRSTVAGGASCYQANAKTVFIHPDVASFYVGACSWTSGARELPDINSDVDVLWGENLTALNNDNTTPNVISATAAINTYCRTGRAFDGTASLGWRITFDLATTNTNARVAGDPTIDLTSVVGVLNGDRIGIELDQIVATGQQQMHWTTVNGAPVGSTVTLTAAIPVGKTVAIGRRVVVIRPVVR